YIEGGHIVVAVYVAGAGGAGQRVTAAAVAKILQPGRRLAGVGAATRSVGCGCDATVRTYRNIGVGVGSRSGSSIRQGYCRRAVEVHGAVNRCGLARGANGVGASQ